MGSKLTKNKNNEQEKDTVQTTENSNNKTTTTVTTAKKKQVEKTKNKKKTSPIIRVDKSTNTESCILPTTAFAEQLVGEPIPTITTTQIKIINQSDLPSEDVQKLREACLTNGTESTVAIDDSQQVSKDNEETIYSSSIVIVTNGDNEQQLIES